MYAPATPALTVTALPPNAIAAGEAAPPPATVAPQVTRLRIRSTVLNVLDGRAASIAGSLRVNARRGTLQPIPTSRSVSTAQSPGTSQPLGASAPAGAARSAEIAARIVTLQALGRHGWRSIAAARTGARGHFRLRYRTDRIGSELLRVRFAGAPGEDGSDHALGRLSVYRLAEASWYGGEGSLACGGWLTSTTLGVANKTLPCGTLVTLRYDGRTVRVPVIDRGPYVAGREYDLTEATKRALGFEGVGEVWATR
jgi:rare lipoprotein A (RlpA)-like double-psi beta-barrel protein